MNYLNLKGGKRWIYWDSGNIFESDGESGDIAGDGDGGLTCVSLELAPGPRQQQGAGIPHISSTSTSSNLTFVA